MSFHDRPGQASRPFTNDRDGYVPADGSSCMILEDLEHAKRRGARIYAEIVGIGNNSDGEANYASPREDGLGLIRCAAESLKMANLSPDDIDLVIPHGTSTQTGDISELLAMQSIFGERDVPIVTIKSLFGHMAASSGSGELILGCKMI
jgi:3-oxoacyl-[acyl-carrier-protein] synthase II